MSAVELVQILTASGVFAGGLGVLKWGFSVEFRLRSIEAVISK